MTKAEWIEKAVAGIEDDYQRKAAARQLEDKISSLTAKAEKSAVLEKMGDPTDYYRKHFSEKSGRRVSIIAGAILLVVGVLFLLAYWQFGDSPIFQQVRWFAAQRNNVLYGSGLLVSIGVVTLVKGLSGK